MKTLTVAFEDLQFFYISGQFRSMKPISIDSIGIGLDSKPETIKDP